MRMLGLQQIHCVRVMLVYIFSEELRTEVKHVRMIKSLI
jgi:hypothetical protein